MGSGVQLQSGNGIEAWDLVFMILAAPLLVAAIVALFVKSTDVIGDYLDQRGTFELSISKRPKAGKAYRHQPGSRPISTTHGLLLVGLVVLALVVLVAWALLSLPSNW